MTNFINQIETSLRENPHTKHYEFYVYEPNATNEIVISGMVRSFYAKLMAQEQVVRLIKEQGVRAKLRNEIVVK